MDFVGTSATLDRKFWLSGYLEVEKHVAAPAFEKVVEMERIERILGTRKNI